MLDTAALCWKILGAAVINLVVSDWNKSGVGYHWGRTSYKATEQRESDLGSLESSPFSGDLWARIVNMWIGQTKKSKFSGRESWTLQAALFS